MSVIVLAGRQGHRQPKSSIPRSAHPRGAHQICVHTSSVASQCTLDTLRDSFSFSLFSVFFPFIHFFRAVEFFFFFFSFSIFFECPILRLANKCAWPIEQVASHCVHVSEQVCVCVGENRG